MTRRSLPAILGLLWSLSVSSAAAADAGWMSVRRDAAARQKLAGMPRQAVAAYFRGTTYQPARSGIPVQGGVFVTFVAPGTDGRLHTRACWGSLQPASGDLATVVCQTTVAALTQDYRQPPVKSTELARLRIVISLVGPLSGVRNGERLQPRREGLYLTDGTRGAVLLPGEALTSEWQESACRQKAGIPPGKPVYRYRFQTLVIEEPQP